MTNDNALAQRYTADTRNPDNSAEAQEGYCKGLESLDDEAMLTKTREIIWLSTYANNNPRSKYHWQVDACYDECQRRGNPEIYTQAYKLVESEVLGG